MVQFELLLGDIKFLDFNIFQKDLIKSKLHLKKDKKNKVLNSILNSKKNVKRYHQAVVWKRLFH